MPKKRLSPEIQQIFALLIAAVSLLANQPNYAADKPQLKIFFDSDQTRHAASAQSIELGMKAAFSEVGNEVQGFDVKFVSLDHRGNTARSKLNVKQALNDPETLLLVGGLHSPPLIKNRDFINENKMLTLVPWAAGAPITRPPYRDNWIFRLSVDDSQAGVRIAEYALGKKACKAPALLLEKTPWGESNRKNMSKALLKSLDAAPDLTWFNWGVSEGNLRIKLRKIISRGSDCLLFVGNANDGRALMNAFISLNLGKKLPVISHWGITGGSFHKAITHSMRQTVDLSFIQSCFSFISTEQTDFTRKAFETAQTLNPELKSASDLEAPAGFIHAYDLGRVLLAAIDQVTLSKDMVANRKRIRASLESLEKPVEGLIKTYNKPFSIYAVNHTSAHEALGLEDLCMATFGADDEIYLVD